MKQLKIFGLALVLLVGMSTTITIKGTDISALLNLKANLISPAFTGTPTAPTATAANNSTTIATTAYVDGKTQVVYLSSDFSTASTSLTDVTGLSFPIEANENIVYSFEINVTTSASNGIRYAVNAPSGASGRINVFGTTTSVSAFTTGTGTSINTQVATSLVSFTATETVNRVWGVIRNGSTAGTVQLRVNSQNAANTLTIKSNSTVIATRQ